MSKEKFTSGETWATRYRPKTLDDVIGQTAAVNIIRGILKTKRLPNVLIISGPTGSGKTTLMELIAGEVNGWREDGRPWDYHDVNVGADNGIDLVRGLITTSRFLPKKNINIIALDEVHSLTKQGSNALLKPLEEIRSTTTFMLATTEPEKLLPTIRGRGTKLVLDRPTPEEVVPLLQRVAKAEKSRLAKVPKALLALATSAGGQPRESLQQLYLAHNMIESEGVTDFKKILKAVRSFVSTDADAVAIKVMLAVYKGNLKAILEEFVNTKDFQSMLVRALDINTALLCQKLKAETYMSGPRHRFLSNLKRLEIKTTIPMITHTQNALMDLQLESRSNNASENMLFTARFSKLVVAVNKFGHNNANA